MATEQVFQEEFPYHLLFKPLVSPPPEKYLKQSVGFPMIAVDSLVHNFLHRTGILDSYQLDHAYGPRCHTPKGCLGVIKDLANRINCREFNPSLPASFPRFIQYHIWAYCGQAGENICTSTSARSANQMLTVSSTNSGCVPSSHPKGQDRRLGTPSSSHEPHQGGDIAMSTFEAHCDESIIRFGQGFDAVHRWLDEFQGTPKYRMRHRRSGTMRLEYGKRRPLGN